MAGSHVRVVGVNEKKGSIFGDSQDQFAVIPIGLSAQAVRRPTAHLGHGEAGRCARAPTGRWTRRRSACASQRRLKPEQPNNFGIVTSDTFLGMFRQITAGIFGVLIGVVALSLVVGGIVIMNIMLMVVSERTARDRPAEGARRAAAATSSGSS